MARPISSLPLPEKKRGFKWKSSQARARSAAAGAANLAAYKARGGKSALSHGLQSFVDTGNAPSQIAEKLAAFESGLLSDLGNEPTTAQRALVESTRTALGVCLLASAYLSQGSLSKFKRNRWVLSTLAAYLNTLRRNLTTLGLERRTKDAMSLDAVLADIAEKRTEDAEHD